MYLGTALITDAILSYYACHIFISFNIFLFNHASLLLGLIFLEFYFPIRILYNISESEYQRTPKMTDSEGISMQRILIAVFPIRTRLPYRILLHTRRERTDLKLSNIKEGLHAHATVTRTPPPPDCFRISSYLREYLTIYVTIHSAS